MLAQEDVKQIEQIVEQLLSKQPERLNANVRYELDLRERTVRVEEELKHQRGLMVQGFELMEKRFEQMDKRFEQVEKRIEQVETRIEQVEARIDQVEKRIEQVENRFEQVDKRFEQVDKRFEQVDKRFEQVDKRFEQVDKRFEQMDKRFVELRQDMNTGFMEMNKRLDRFMFWTLGLVVSAVVFVVNYL